MSLFKSVTSLVLLLFPLSNCSDEARFLLLRSLEVVV